MNDPKALALFQEVLKKTYARKLRWEAATNIGRVASDELVAEMMGKYKLRLSPYTSLSNWGEPEGPPVMTLNDEHGNMLVQMSVDVDGITTEDLNRVVVFARRIALNADQKIDELLAELQRDQDN